MTFISYNYFILLIITIIFYYSFVLKHRNWILFLASILFIGSISFSVLLFSVLFTVLNYFGGIILDKNSKNVKYKNIIFKVLIFINLGILIYYKYINFIFENFNFLFKNLNDSIELNLINLILPVGISYYTFQSVGYIIRINRGFEKPERNFINFSSFLLFFPKFLAGPVERSNHFLPQINSLEKFNQTGFSAGMRLILFGVFKKVVIADNLYGPVSIVYSNIHDYSGITLILVLIIQLIYIYCDFSGYTDIALGSAKLFGIDIIDNFNRPFMAKTITDFWKRWHISLSSWCNEFIYLPFIIKYRKLGNIAAILGIFVTFLIIGIWHGANWTFIVLGLLQALAIIYEFFTKRFRIMISSKLPEWFSSTFSRILVFFYMSISMVFFLSVSVKEAWYFITHLFKNIEFNFTSLQIIHDKPNFLIALNCFIFVFLYEILKENGFDLQINFLKQPRWVRWSAYYFLLFIMIIFNSEISAFVYKQF